MKNKILTISTLSLLTVLTACGGGGGGSSSGNNNSGDGGSNSNGGNNSNFTYFIPFSDNGSGLWKTNGTSNGSSKIADIDSETQFAVINGNVLFTVKNGNGKSVLKRIKNGTTTTIHDKSGIITRLTKAGNYVYFAEQTVGTDNYNYINLWVTDGNSAPIKIPNSQEIDRLHIEKLGQKFHALGDNIYYSLNNTLYVSSYTDTKVVTSDVTMDTNFLDFAAHDGYMYFLVGSLTNSSVESVFKTNGSNATQLSTHASNITGSKIVFVDGKPYLFSTNQSNTLRDASLDHNFGTDFLRLYSNATFIRGLIFQTESLQNSEHAVAYDDVLWSTDAYSLYDNSTKILSYDYINDTIIMEDVNNIIATNLDGKFVKIDSNCGTDIRDIVGHDANNIYFMKDYKLYKSAGLKVVNGNASFTCELLKDDTLNMPSER